MNESFDKNNINELKWSFVYCLNGEEHSHTKYVIYKIENIISGKVYIGQTRRMLWKRWQDYKNDLLKPIQAEKRSGSNAKLKHSVQKHFKNEGNMNFLKFSIIEIVDISGLNSEEEKKLKLDEREQFYIKEYRNLFGKNKVCNILDGGRTHVFTKSDRETMGKSQKFFYQSEKGEEKKQILRERFSGSGNPMYGKTHTEEAVEKNRKSNIGKQAGKNNPMFGKSHSDEAKNKVSLKNRDRVSPLKNTKRLDIFGAKNPSSKIYDLSLNPLISPSGEEFTRIECLEEFCRKYNLLSNKMCCLLKKKSKTHRGWRLKC